MFVNKAKTLAPSLAVTIPDADADAVLPFYCVPSPCRIDVTKLAVNNKVMSKATTKEP